MSINTPSPTVLLVQVVSVGAKNQALSHTEAHALSPDPVPCPGLDGPKIHFLCLTGYGELWFNSDIQGESRNSVNKLREHCQRNSDTWSRATAGNQKGSQEKAQFLRKLHRDRIQPCQLEFRVGFYSWLEYRGTLNPMTSVLTRDGDLRPTEEKVR